MYVFAYFSEQKYERHYEWSRKALANTAYLIYIPSAYTLIESYCLQGPKIFIIVIESLTITIFMHFLPLIGIAVFVNKKWYAFFIIHEVKCYESILRICQSFLQYRFSVVVFSTKTFRNLKEIVISNLYPTYNLNV